MGSLLKRIVGVTGLIATAAVCAVADIAGAPAGRYIINRSTWAGQQFSVNHSTATSLAVTGLTSGECVQAGTDGLLTTAGAACGSGGGMSPGATYYIQVRDTLQTGATFYVSSGTVAGNLFTNALYAGTNIGTTTSSGYSLTGVGFNALQIGQVASIPTSDTTRIRWFTYPNNRTAGYFNYRHFASGSLGGSNLQPSGFNVSDYLDNPIVFINSSEGVAPSIFSSVALHRGLILPTTSVLTLMDGDSSHFVGIKAPDVVTSTYTLKFPPADGTNGQAIVTDGSGNLSFYSVSGSAPSNSILLKDSDGILWSVNLQTTGNLTTTSLGAQSFDPEPIQLVDSNSDVWNLTVTTSGALNTELVP